MHNLDHFLRHVEDDIATDGDSVASLPAPTSSAAVAKGKKNKGKTVVAVEAEPVEETKSTKSAESKKESTLNGGVNFVLNDIDNAHSLVRMFSFHNWRLLFCPWF